MVNECYLLHLNQGKRPERVNLRVLGQLKSKNDEAFNQLIGFKMINMI